jgi:hypothetical protein
VCVCARARTCELIEFKFALVDDCRPSHNSESTLVISSQVQLTEGCGELCKATEEILLLGSNVH